MTRMSKFERAGINVVEAAFLLAEHDALSDERDGLGSCTELSRLVDALDVYFTAVGMGDSERLAALSKRVAVNEASGGVKA